MQALTMRLAALAALLAALGGCVSVSIEEGLQQLRAQDAIVLPVTWSESGGMLVDAAIDGDGPYPFLVDSGATTSALFEDARLRLGKEFVPGRMVEVFGIVDSELRPVVGIRSLSVGPMASDRTELVVLDTRRIAASGEAYGLIGLDVLRSHVIAYNPDEQALYVLDPSSGLTAAELPGWIDIPLHVDPYGTGVNRLYFIDVDVDDRTIPGLLDLGSAFTLMNWIDVEHANLLWVRRVLQRDWEVEGAIGSFLPTIRAEFGVFKLDTFPFYEHDVIVHEFDSENVTGAAGQPLFIAGIDLFREMPFIIDFPGQTLYLPRTAIERPDRNVTGSLIPTDEPNPNILMQMQRREE